jgi:hypothetical protein
MKQAGVDDEMSLYLFIIVRFLLPCPLVNLIIWYRIVRYLSLQYYVFAYICHGLSMLGLGRNVLFHYLRSGR